MTTLNAKNGAAEPPADRTALAIALAMLGVTCITFADIATKWISTDISLWQLLTMRSIVGLVLILPVLLLSRRLSSLQIKNFRALAIRTLIMCITYVLFFTSLGQLPLAIVAGAFFAGPMFMVVLSVIMLKEPVGIWRILSVVSGFIGVILILRPDSADFALIMLMPVASGFFYALAQVYTRKYCKQEDPLAISYWLTFTFMLMGLSGMLSVHWLADGNTTHFLNHPAVITGLIPTLIIAAIGISSLIMHFSMAAAYQNAPASLIAPLEYMYLPMAVMGGMIWLDETPSFSAIVGISIIIVAGLIIAWREKVMRRKLRQQTGN
ncbi:MAG: DMT family transporter [Thiolinea sp.]